MWPGLERCEKYSTLTMLQNTERGCCVREHRGPVTALVTRWALPPRPWKALAAPPLPPAPLETSWKRTYLLHEFGCCISEYHGDGRHRDERTDFYWLASSFQGPSPYSPSFPTKLHSSHTHKAPRSVHPAEEEAEPPELEQMK